MPTDTLQYKVYAMETNWAADHLQTIRTLMERSAVYRRALAPIMTFTGVVGLTGAGLGWCLKIHSGRAFVFLWAGVAAVALVGSFLLVRRQALKDAEPFWSPPTRRTVQAMLPALTVGLFLGAIGALDGGSDISRFLSLAWCIAYGCALHAAGFFTPRGIRLLGWIFILAGCGAVVALLLTSKEGVHGGFYGLLWALFDERGLFMGMMFGCLHLAYGIYLYFTEQRKNAT